MTTAVDPEAPVSTAGQIPPPEGFRPPLSAAECAERAAACLKEAAQPALAEHREILLGCADQWRQLGQSMATHPSMNRPRDDRDDHRR